MYVPPLSLLPSTFSVREEGEPNTAPVFKQASTTTLSHIQVYTISSSTSSGSLTTPTRFKSCTLLIVNDLPRLIATRMGEGRTIIVTSPLLVCCVLVGEDTLNFSVCWPYAKKRGGNESRGESLPAGSVAVPSTTSHLNTHCWRGRQGGDLSFAFSSTASERRNDCVSPPSISTVGMSKSTKDTDVLTVVRTPKKLVADTANTQLDPATVWLDANVRVRDVLATAIVFAADVRQSPLTSHSKLTGRRPLPDSTTARTTKFAHAESWEGASMDKVGGRGLLAPPTVTDPLKTSGPRGG
mmetsp:Transcript_28229/g.72004  ORF Transcript_28229/g.72004 Transcript_28229/m.72004 type:complete len:297 (+) Transcript_28229:2285-3175(+)